MDLTKLSTADILAELEKRSEVTKSDESVLVFGTIGIDAGSNFVEIFKEIKTEKDLDFINQVSLRARFNSHRYYQGFYFKTTEFEKLEKNLNDNNEQFANWIRETNSVKYTKL
jgi:hypothetical protein